MTKIGLDDIYSFNKTHAPTVFDSTIQGVDGTNYTIGSGDAKPLKEFLKIVGQVANDLHDGEPVELGFGKITSNVISLPITTFDVTKLYKDTGFKPLIPFRKGIERTARWIKEDEGM